jgi:hypothetical protein
VRAPIEVLGWFMLGFTLLWPFARTALNGVIVSAAIPSWHEWRRRLYRPGISVFLAVVAFGILTVFRALAWATRLQHEVDETV